MENLENREEIYEDLKKELEVFLKLDNLQNYEGYPLIYHLDVAAMYPNIILTNRL